MKVAVTAWNNRVSPVFDTARNLVVAAVEDGRTVERVETACDETLWPDRVRHLLKQGVDVLICGGISPGLADMVSASGIKVVSGVAGDVEKVLEAFAAGKLPSPRFLMPGWRCGKRRRCRRGRGTF